MASQSKAFETSNQRGKKREHSPDQQKDRISQGAGPGDDQYLMASTSNHLNRFKVNVRRQDSTTKDEAPLGKCETKGTPVLSFHLKVMS